MGVKTLGALFIILGCGGVGFKLAAAHRYEEHMLRQLVNILDYMECELQYHLTPLPMLCRQAAVEGTALMREIFLKLATELEDQIQPDVERCMENALTTVNNVPRITKETLVLLGRSLGRFDIDGQLKGLEAIRQHCRRELEILCKDKDLRLRNYKTLGLCAGAALAIIFI